jgi:hypothetical protein
MASGCSRGVWSLAAHVDRRGSAWLALRGTRSAASYTRFQEHYTVTTGTSEARFAFSYRPLHAIPGAKRAGGDCCIRAMGRHVRHDPTHRRGLPPRLPARALASASKRSGVGNFAAVFQPGACHGSTGIDGSSCCGAVEAAPARAGAGRAEQALVVAARPACVRRRRVSHRREVLCAFFADSGTLDSRESIAAKPRYGLAPESPSWRRGARLSRPSAGDPS